MNQTERVIENPNKDSGLTKVVVQTNKDTEVQTPPQSANKKKKKRRPKGRGRRKIDIEYIVEKSKRQITFSKRKSGLLKKAFELSTLTGTQILVLVTSESGHCFTFATKHFQPLIRDVRGKDLIQTLLSTKYNADEDGTKEIDETCRDNLKTKMEEFRNVIENQNRQRMYMNQMLQPPPLPHYSNQPPYYQQPYHQPPPPPPMCQMRMNYNSVSTAPRMRKEIPNQDKNDQDEDQDYQQEEEEDKDYVDEGDKDEQDNQEDEI